MMLYDVSFWGVIIIRTGYQIEDSSILYMFANVYISYVGFLHIPKKLHRNNTSLSVVNLEFAFYT